MGSCSFCSQPSVSSYALTALRGDADDRASWRRVMASSCKACHTALSPRRRGRPSLEGDGRTLVARARLRKPLLCAPSPAEYETDRLSRFPPSLDTRLSRCNRSSPSSAGPSPPAYSRPTTSPSPPPHHPFCTPEARGHFSALLARLSAVLAKPLSPNAPPRRLQQASARLSYWISINSTSKVSSALAGMMGG